MGKILDFFARILVVVTLPLWWWVLLLPNKAKSIVIIGPKRSGKTTLWKMLGGKENILANTGVELIPSFEITRQDGTKVKIQETSDIGGEDEMVGDFYAKLIKEGTFIYYLVSSTDVLTPSTMKRVRSDLLKIDTIAKEKKIEESIGLKFILTNFYDYKNNNPESNEYDLYRLFLKGLEASRGRGVVGKKLNDDDIYKIMMVAELDEEKAAKLGTDYINKIKNEIGG